MTNERPDDIPSAETPKLGFFLNIKTGKVISDFLGTVHASETLIPITPEQASRVEAERLWGPSPDEEEPF